MGSLEGLYVHVPFCPTLCPYCDFQVVRRFGGIVEAYLKRLGEEARELHASHPEPLQTLYLGGGTPSFLRSAELARLREALPWGLEGAEVTLEANPGTLNRERLELLRALGVNRLSIGVQSFQDPVLKTLGRAHGRKGALKAVEMSLETGFRTSLDLILGLPGQELEADLREARALGVGHISAYTLQIEPGTPFELANLHTDEEQEALAFERAEEILGEAGLVRYEVSNFARPGQESRHNRLYWQTRFWGALGPGAAGHYRAGQGVYSRRTTNPPLPRWLGGEAPLVEEIGPLEHAREALMLGLRLREGVDVQAIERRTGLELWEALSPRMEKLVAQGALRAEGQRLSVPNLNLVHGAVLELWEGLEASPL
ncbi:radical SAM family heme chaperone HemW [Meiothermus granaticius]|uniref:Heme chaperone HemW n=1 Tax=Meiothermus granaticius NBRC 107808 TaxID=1227551 RepID=A0A399F8N2_9DEIN|nr:radical SAM family heme chaperone HemW [Meiothermus granaticius]RIH92453.1 Oxygen-independent coproporphyrinogen-III oxidase-like protein [Meiothermus granaticius NBRC 107808]GEM87151.1 coproporphyrinogen III oxidase [Meiothermus granaticius NBRC 107808]